LSIYFSFSIAFF